MNIFLQHVVPYLLAYKYVALFIIAFVAAFVIPIPSGSVLMMTTALASNGYFNLGIVIVISIIANILGDNLGYWVARFYGEKTFSRIGFRRVLRSKTFKEIEQKFRRHPGFIVLASRFEVISTLSINLLAGIGKVPYKKYLIFESIGSISQVCFYGLIGYTFGYNWQSVNTLMGKILMIILLIFVFLILNYKKKIIAYLRKKE